MPKNIKKTIVPEFGMDFEGKYLTRVDTNRKIVVVGAGAFGGWTALTLLKNGYNVTLIDTWVVETIDLVRGERPD